jgi:hypothetical protein
MKNLKISALVIGVLGIFLGISGCSPSIGNSGSGEGSSGGSDSGSSESSDQSATLGSGSIAGKIEKVLYFSSVEPLSAQFKGQYIGDFLLEDGSLVQREYGRDYFSPVDLKGIKYIPNYSSVRNSEQDYNECALTKNSDVYCWGSNEYGEVGNGTFDSTLKETIQFCLNEDCSWKGPRHIFSAIKILSGVESLIAPYDYMIASGYQRYQHTYCALTIDGNAYCWGENIGFADASESKISTPKLVDLADLDPLVYDFADPIEVLQGAAPITKVEIGSSQKTSCEISTSGKVACQGYNSPEGMLLGKDYKTSNYSANLIEIVGVEKAESFTHNMIRPVWGGDPNKQMCVLRTDDKVQCWGDDFNEGIVTYTP